MWNTIVLFVGFGALLFSNMPPTRELGLMVMVGIVASLVATFLLMPLLMAEFRARNSE